MALHPNAPGELEAVEPATAHIRTAEYELFASDSWASWLYRQVCEPIGMRALRDALPS
jgi:chitin disaccharide deacetylase